MNEPDSKDVQKLEPAKIGDNQSNKSDTQDDAKSTIRKELMQRFQMPEEEDDAPEPRKVYKKGIIANNDESIEVEDDKTELNSAIVDKDSDPNEGKHIGSDNIQFNTTQYNTNVNKSAEDIEEKTKPISVEGIHTGLKAFEETHSDTNQLNNKEHIHQLKGLEAEDTSYDERSIDKNNDHHGAIQYKLGKTNTISHLNKQQSNEKTPSSSNSSRDTSSATNISHQSSTSKANNEQHFDTCESDKTAEKFTSNALNSSFEKKKTDEFSTHTKKAENAEKEKKTENPTPGGLNIPATTVDSNVFPSNQIPPVSNKINDGEAHGYRVADGNDYDDDDDDDSIVLGSIAEHRNINGSLDSTKVQQNKVKGMASAFNEEANQNQFKSSNSTSLEARYQQNKVRDMASAFINDNEEPQNERVQHKNVALNGQQNKMESFNNIKSGQHQNESVHVVPIIGLGKDSEYDNQGIASFRKGEIEEQPSSAHGSIDIRDQYSTAKNMTFVSAAVLPGITTHTDQKDDAYPSESSPDTPYTEHTATKQTFSTTTVIKETDQGQEHQFLSTSHTDQSTRDFEDEDEYYIQGAAYGSGDFGIATGQRAKMEKVHVTPNFLSAESVPNEHASNAHYDEYKNTVYVSNIAATQGSIHIEHQVQANETAITENNYEANNTNLKSKEQKRAREHYDD